MLTDQSRLEGSDTQAVMPVPSDKVLNSVEVSDAALIAGIFRSAHFDVVDYGQHYRTVAQHTGLDLGASIAALENMPLANEGEHHKQLRVRSAAAVAINRRENAVVMDKFIADTVSHSFRKGAELDLVSDLAVPVFNRLYGLLTGVIVSDDPGVSQVFCGRMSLNRRRDINTGLENLNATLDRTDPIIPRDVAVTFAILASDSLVGSLALSLWEIFLRNPGKPIDEIDFPGRLPSTGVPYIDRVANTDVELGGVSFAKGQRVRLMLEATSLHASAKEHDLLFGKGRHLCIGKPLTHAIWNSLTEALGAVPLRATLVEMKMRPRDYVFSYPQFARIGLND